MVNILGQNINVVGYLDIGFWIFLALIILGFIGVWAWIYFYISKFKYKFRVREIINGRKILFDDKAKEFKDSDGVSYWKLLKRKDIVHCPPADAVDIDSKGHKSVEAYRTSSGEYVYIKDLGQIAEAPKEVTDIQDPKKRGEALIKWKKDNEVDDVFFPLSTNQRLLYITEIKKAMMRRTKKWQDYILPIVAIASLVIIVVSLMIFWGDIAKPALTAREMSIMEQELINQNLIILQQIKQDVQVIKEDKTGGGSTAPN
jgi:hypothetical protein